MLKKKDIDIFFEDVEALNFRFPVASLAAVNGRPVNKRRDFSICDRMILTRKMAGQTQEQMASDMKISLSSLKQIETKRNRPTIDMIVRWHYLYRRSYDWILEGK